MLKFAKMWVILFALSGVMAGCSDDDDNVTPPAPQEKPVLKPSFENPFKVASAGGDFTLTFTVENPVVGGVLSASTGAEWIETLRIDDLSVMSAILTNKAHEERRAKIEVVYSYGKEKTVYSVEVIQEGLREPEVKPEFEMPVMVEAGGGDVELKFMVRNDAGKGRLSAASGVDWLSFKSHETDDRILVASVLPNETDAERRVEVTVSYKHEGGQIDIPVEIIQKKQMPFFMIEILETTSDGVRARVTPRDPEMFYVASAVEKCMIDGYESEERFLEDEIKYLHSMSDMFGQSMLEILDSIGARGTQEISITTIPSQMECYFFVYGATYEENPKVLTPLFKEVFTTK